MGASDTVLARDAAILAQLRKGPLPFAGLRDALPREPGQTDDQRVRACSNSLTRLRVRKQIAQDKDGNWAVA